MGAAIFDYTGHPIAALSVAGPEAVVACDVPRLSLAVTIAAADASARFGHRTAADAHAMLARRTP